MLNETERFRDTTDGLKKDPGYEVAFGITIQK